MSHKLYYEGPKKRLGSPENLKAHLQWKGGPCVDTVCICGASWHRCNTGFMYVLRCPKCDRAYHVDDSIEIVEMTSDEKADLDAFRDEVYKPHQESYVPWCSMEGDDTGVMIDGTPGCRTCFSSYEDCECPCLQEQVKQLKDEIYQLKKSAESIHPNDLRNCLSQEQFEKLSSFMDAELKKIGPLHSIGPFTVEFTPTGLGTCVEVSCSDTGARLDLTEKFG